MSKHKGVNEKRAIRTGQIAPRRPRSKKEEQEFGPAPKEYIICSECSSVFFNKSWHHKIGEDLKHLKPHKKVRLKNCPACKMKKDKVFEGQLTITLKGNPGAEDKIMKVIKNIDEQAQEKDPMDRILWTEKEGKEIKIFTSENQLAVRMGKKLDSVFKGGTIEIRYSHKEDVARVYWQY